MRTTSNEDPVTFYAQEVVARRIVAGPLVRAQCQRHLNDLKLGHLRGLVWRLDKAMRAINYFKDVLRLPAIDKDDVSGEEMVDLSKSEPFILHISQKFIVGSIFGWYNVDNTSRFRIAYIEEGKGNGKSPLAAGIGLYKFTAEKKENAEVYASAAVKDQAKIQYRDAVNMVGASEDLAEFIQKHGEKEVYNMVNLKTRGFFKPISAEKRGLDGKRVYCSLIDELHEHPSSIVADKMRAGTKGNGNALIFEITNSGVDKLSICYQHHEYSARVVNGETVDDSWFAYVCGMDEDDDPFVDESCWIKANPLLGISITLRYLRELVNAAKGMPAQESMVRRLNFCQWVDAENPWMSGYMWRNCEQRFDFAELLRLNDAIKDVEPVGALDLSGSRDLTALGLMWELPDEIIAAVEFWTPRDTLAERSRKERVPYDVWVKQHFLHAPPGRAVDYGFVAQRLVDIQHQTGLRRFAFDAYRIKYLEVELDRLGAEFVLVPHGQGYYKSAESGLWMPHSIQRLEAHIFAANPEVEPSASDAEGDQDEPATPSKPAKPLRVIWNPVLTHCIASTVTEADPKENKIFTKRKSKGRIDGSVALAMAAGLLDLAEEKVSVGMMAL